MAEVKNRGDARCRGSRRLQTLSEDSTVRGEDRWRKKAKEEKDIALKCAR